MKRQLILEVTRPSVQSSQQKSRRLLRFQKADGIDRGPCSLAEQVCSLMVRHNPHPLRFPTDPILVQAISMAYVLTLLELRIPTNYYRQVIGSVSTMLRLLYEDRYTSSDAQSNIASIAFAGTVVGHLGFGYLSDRWSRRNTLLISTVST